MYDYSAREINSLLNKEVELSLGKIENEEIEVVLNCKIIDFSAESLDSKLLFFVKISEENGNLRTLNIFEIKKILLNEQIN